MRRAWLVLALAVAGCSGSDESQTRVEVLPHGGEMADEESIGMATMEPDGTIVLYLRAEDDESGAVGDATLLYPRSDPDYRRVLDHLGGLSPGEEKPVRPFPDSWD